MKRLRQDCADPIHTARCLPLSTLMPVAVLWVAGCVGAFTEIPGLDGPDGRIFAQRCSACHGKPFGSHGITHGVPDPRFRTMEEWRKELSRMEDLMREKGLSTLTDAEREAINRYLSRHAKS